MIIYRPPAVVIKLNLFSFIAYGIFEFTATKMEFQMLPIFR